MEALEITVKSGLEGIVVAQTSLSEVDGRRGRLIYRGFLVEQLAGARCYEDVAHLFWEGSLPNSRESAALCEAIGKARVKAFEALPKVGNALSAPNGMDALRASLSHLRAQDDETETMINLVGATPVFAAAWWRMKNGKAPVAPDPSSSVAADYYRMCHGESADPRVIRALDAYLVTVMDHGMNASTFAARVVSSTGSDPVSSVVAGIGALKGPLHGGAPGPVLDMIDAVGEPEHAAAWVAGELAAGNRIMGMGHRVYRVRDPRAFVLEKQVEKLVESGLATKKLSLARAVEKAAEEALAKRYPTRPLRANVEFYTAVLLDAVGLDRQQFTPTFAVGRMAGWLAHTREQHVTGRLIRPDAVYIGPKPMGEVV